MARVEKNAAGKDVPVDTPAYGCFVIEETKPAAQKNKAAAKAEADQEGAN
jgi:hypothetical protein